MLTLGQGVMLGVALDGAEIGYNIQYTIYLVNCQLTAICLENQSFPVVNESAGRVGLKRSGESRLISVRARTSFEG